MITEPCYDERIQLDPEKPLPIARVMQEVLARYGLTQAPRYGLAELDRAAASPMELAVA